MIVKIVVEAFMIFIQFMRETSFRIKSINQLKMRISLRKSKNLIKLIGWKEMDEIWWDLTISVVADCRVVCWRADCI